MLRFLVQASLRLVRSEGMERALRPTDLLRVHGLGPSGSVVWGFVGMC